MKQFPDQLGTLHTFETAPKRIISLVPSQTELLYDLGLEEKIIGITKFCVHPYHLKATKKVVGGTKKIHLEKIKLLQPDIIICNKEENTKEIVDQLSEICPVWVTNIITIEDNLQMISDFGNIFNCQESSNTWIQKLTDGLSDFRNFIAEKPTFKTAYFIWKTPYMVAGNNTFINEMMQLNHFENVMQSNERYPEIQLSDLDLLKNSSLILLSSEPYPFKNEDAQEMRMVFPKSKILLVNGEMFSWHGTRLLKALAYFKELRQKI